MRKPGLQINEEHIVNYPYLSSITGPADVKNLRLDELSDLCAEMRTALIEKTSAYGGHIASNLGTVELTTALHYVFESPRDKIVFDVSHQSYNHKMLTGRAVAFIDPEHYADVSGYTNPKESDHDFFSIGHTSTSVSLALGFARVRDLRGEGGNVVAVIGDGSLPGGMALEALEYLGEQGGNLIVVINDNEQAISEVHGGIYQNLALLRATHGQAERNMFRSWGLDYLYVPDGHDVLALVDAFQKAKDVDHPIVVHTHTVKGKGLSFAEADPESWHFVGGFDPATGEQPDYGESNEEHIVDFLMKKMAADPMVVALTAATSDFPQDVRAGLGRQYVDVCICEQNAAGMTAGLAKAGAKPVWTVYGPFIQRTYDQLSHDICVNNLPATILVLAAGIGGIDDETHLGFFDVPMMSHLPNLTYLAPTSVEETLAMLDWSIEQEAGPVAIRVPTTVMHADRPVPTSFDDTNRYEVVRPGEGIAVIAMGNFYPLGKKLAAAIEQAGRPAPTLINPRYLTGIDEDLLSGLLKAHDQVVTIEDCCLEGGLGEKIARFFGPTSMRVRCYGLAKEFIDRYDIDEVMRARRLTVPQIMEDLGLL